MALQRNQPAALRRRVVGTALGVDVVAALVIGLAISSLIGWIVFVIGVVVAGFLYYNITQVMRTRGY
jgi:ABC-type dipeptide/oligopeptide/nickel transport system permease subunit